MRVLVATDLTEAADAALREGAALARAPTHQLAVVHVIPSQARESMFFPARDEALATRAAHHVESATKAVRERVAKVVSRETEIFVDEGIVYAAILRRAEEWRADVIVIGPHRSAGLSRVLGDVAADVVRHARCRVLVARSGAAHGWVVAATDLSRSSRRTILAAAVEAQRRGARLKVVHAVGFIEVEVAYLLELATPSIAHTSSGGEPGLAALRQTVATLGIDASSEVLDAPAAPSIVDDAAALGAELIVVGVHARKGVTHFGGVAQKVVQAAPCSVLVVR